MALTAIAVHGEIVGARLLVSSCLLIGLALAALVAIIAVRLLTDWAIPGWSSYLAVALISIILQAFHYVGGIYFPRVGRSQQYELFAAPRL